jgi:uncharacterized membrane protein
MNPATWSATAAIGSAFLASLVEVVEAFTVVLAAATLRGWRPAAIGAAAAVGTLTALIAGFGPLLAAMPVKALQFAIGVLLLLFGMGWLRKAILRAAEALPLHDEAAIFVTETARVTTAIGRRHRSRDWIAGLMAFKAVLLEGLEVVFIVLAFGAGGRLLWPAACGALAACLLMLAVGVAIRRPLAAVPENALKYSVGVLLSAFGVFWTGQGLGIAWPGGDLALPVVASTFLLAGLATASLLRHSVETLR